MDKELIENIANALAVSEICPFAHEDCIDNCHKHFSNWLDNHDKQIRTEVIAEISREMRMLYGNEYEKQIRAEELDKISKMMLLGCDELKCEECDYRLYSQDVCQQAYTIGIIEKYIAEQLKEQK